MTPVVRYGRVAPVFYYECVKFGKKLTNCPIKRVNALTLHNCVKAEIVRAAEHPTRMNALISEAVQVLPKQDHLPIDLAAVSKKLRELDKNIANIVKAIEQGVSPLSLSRRLEQLEAERQPLNMKVMELEGQIEASHKTRPSKEFVCAQWTSMMELWEEGDEAERMEIMQGTVRRVVMTEKEEGTCDLAIMPQVPSRWLISTNHLGAGMLCW